MRSRAAQTVKIGKARLARLESVRVFTYAGRKGVKRAGIRRVNNG